jgi:hypothetical protein
MEALQTLEAMGLTLPGPAYIAGAVLFGIIGVVAYWHGRKAKLPVPKWIGIALMFYPYAIAETWLLYVVGAALCVALYINWRTRA